MALNSQTGGSVTGDAELIRRYQKGDLDAFEEFMRRYQDRVFRTAGSLLFDPGLAEDAAQEVFLRAYRGLKGFGFRSSPYTWMYAATKNVCREFNRKEKGHSEMDFDIAIAETHGRELDTRHCMRVVHAMISRLPERQRDVVLLRVFEELSVEDTAKALRCRPGTVKASLHKAMKKLRAFPQLESLRWREKDE